MINVKHCEPLDVGIPILDQGRKQFINHVNTLLDNIQNTNLLPEVLVQLSDLAEHASQYFRFEETFLYHELDEYEFSDHRVRHLFFENFFRAPIIQKTDDDQCDTEELAAFIVDWLNFHVQNLDKKLSDSRDVKD